MQKVQIIKRKQNKLLFSNVPFSTNASNILKATLNNSKPFPWKGFLSQESVSSLVHGDIIPMKHMNGAQISTRNIQCTIAWSF